MQTMTQRQEHAENLQTIALLSGERYYRKMSFKEAKTWLRTYSAYKIKGYPKSIAAQYAWDHYYIDRKQAQSKVWEF